MSNLFTELSKYSKSSFAQYLCELSIRAESKSAENVLLCCPPLAPNGRRLGVRAGAHKGSDGRQTSKIPQRCPRATPRLTPNRLLCDGGIVCCLYVILLIINSCLVYFSPSIYALCNIFLFLSTWFLGLLN
jgi:hypothetical protein